MLHVKDSLIYGAPLYTWGNFGVSFLNSAVFSLHLRRAVGQSSVMIFQRRMEPSPL